MTLVCVLNTEQFMSITMDNLSRVFLLESLPFCSKSGIDFCGYIDKYFLKFELSTKDLLVWKQTECVWWGRSI